MHHALLDCDYDCGILVAALGFSINEFEMSNQTFNTSKKFFLQNIYCVFVTAAKKMIGSTNPSLIIDGFGRTHANATTEYQNEVGEIHWFCTKNC